MIICSPHRNRTAQSLRALRINDDLLTVRGFWPTSAPILLRWNCTWDAVWWNGKFHLVFIVLLEICSQSIIRRPHAPFSSKRVQINSSVDIFCWKCSVSFGFGLLTFPPLYTPQLLIPEPGPSVVMRECAKKEREKKGKNPGLIKCLAVYVPSQFISLCLESIADVWERDCWGRSQLLQKWGTLFRKSMKS